jgi:hypothetical protein
VSILCAGHFRTCCGVECYEPHCVLLVYVCEVSCVQAVHLNLCQLAEWVLHTTLVRPCALQQRLTGRKAVQEAAQLRGLQRTTVQLLIAVRLQGSSTERAPPSRL